MSPTEILAELRRRDVYLECRVDRLWVDAPEGALTEDFRQALREHKAEILAVLRTSEVPSWPLESLEAEQRFGRPEARLYPFLGKQVLTPQGMGRLAQVFAQRVIVTLNQAPSRASAFLPSEVVPPTAMRYPHSPTEEAQ